jgi:xylulokinase
LSPVVLGVDSSTQSCKVVAFDSDTNQIIRESRAQHPNGTEVYPELWWDALLDAIKDCGGFEGVSAISVAGQQHGMVLLDQDGNLLRDALLWNDTRSGPEAKELVEKFGLDFLTEKTGLVPVASFTATKVLWVRNHEPEIAAKVSAVCLPHDYLSWRLSEHYPDINKIFTDRSDASGTGYFNSNSNSYVEEIFEYCLGKKAILPKVLGPTDSAGKVRSDLATHEVLIGAGMGDNAGAARGLDLAPGMFAVSLGTSGTVFGASKTGSADKSGFIAGFADATGNFLPLVCTLNAARVIEWGASLLGVSFEEFGRLALQANPGAGGLTVIPYLEGERTPNLPDATASVEGITLENGSRENFARACIEGMLRGLALGSDLISEGGHMVSQISLIGGAAANPAVRQIAQEIFRAEVVFPESQEYVALGAAKQAADLVSS